jgi:energy-coupling factor transporter ATP-binding protein EcfA2
MNKIGIEYVKFPNGKEYNLIPEENTIWKSGIEFPAEVEEKTLFVTGLSGTGKSTLVSKLSEGKERMYSGQVFLPFPKLKSPAVKRVEGVDNLADLSKLGLIDGHFIFEIPKVKDIPFFAHEDSVCDADYCSLNVGKRLRFPNELKRNFIFEIRQPSARVINDNRKRRYEEQISKGIPSGSRHSYFPRTDEETQKGIYLYYQAAHQLYKKGVSVYIRTSLDGKPLRFAE